MRLPLMDAPNPTLERLASWVPKSPKEMRRVQRRLATAGYLNFGATVAYSFAEIILPLGAAGITLWWLGVSRGWLPALFAAVVGYVVPTFWLSRKIELRKRQIRNGLPDALDLILLCIEAGSSVDQAVVKTSNELAITHPALADEMRLITTEMRAGKPRLDKLEDVCTLPPGIQQVLKLPEDSTNRVVRKVVEEAVDENRVKSA